MLGAVVLIMLLLVAAPVALDIAVGSQIYPDSPLYIVERWGEAIEILVARALNRSDIIASIAVERADELLQMVAENKTRYVQSLADDIDELSRVCVEVYPPPHQCERLVEKLRMARNMLEELNTSITNIVVVEIDSVVKKIEIRIEHLHTRTAESVTA